MCCGLRVTCAHSHVLLGKLVEPLGQEAWLSGGVTGESL